MSDTQKPRVRVPAGSSGYTRDGYINFAASLGYGAANQQSGSTYGFNPISRNHTLLEWAYRGSWLVRQIVDAVADDMTREGVSIESDMPPDDMDKLYEYMNQLLIWQRVNSAIKWARLYGGAIAVIMVDGQKPETPLRVEAVGKDQFKGLMVLDRWMVWPALDNPVTEIGQDYGMPKFYEVVSDAKAVPKMKIHYSRCIRLEGADLPYWQKMAENGWGLSVIEPLYDRIIAFDSASAGTSQLVYRAHLRTMKVEKLRELIAFGQAGYQAFLDHLKMIRLMQSNEGLTVLDATDEFETHSYNFGGLSDVLIQFAQQISGAAQIPLVRLFGQSPAGMNATGESDVRNYYDMINAQQESRLRRPFTTILELAHRSLFGRGPPKGFSFSFASLWQMADDQKAKVAVDVAGAVTTAFQDGIISAVTAMKELRQSSKITGVFSNITDEDIEDAENAAPLPSETGGLPDEGGWQPGMPQGKAAMPPPMPPGQGAGEAAEGEEGPPHPDSDRAKLPPTKPAHVAKMYAKDSATVQGPDDDSTAVWMVMDHDPDTKTFQEMKFLVGFSDRGSALAAFKETHDRADERIGTVKRMSLDSYKQYVAEYATAS